MNDKWMPREEFDKIYSKVPRICVEVVIKTNNGVLLTKRAIDLGKGLWHFPGSTVFFGETFEEAVKRTAKDELGVDVEILKFLDYLEFKDKETAPGHTVSLAFLCKINSGDIKLNWQATEFKYFKEIPNKIFKEHADLLKEQFNMK